MTQAGPVPEIVELTEPITAGPAQALAGLLGVAQPDLAGGDPLPLLWHWVYLLDRPSQAALGPDGHRAAGGVPLPPGPGRRRMFAGGRAWQRGPLRAGTATRRTWVAGTADKHGRSGRLSFVTVRTEISQCGDVVAAEEQDIVYRDAPAGPSAAAGTAEPGTAEPGTAEPGTAEPGTAEPGTAETGTAETGTAETGTAETGTAGTRLADWPVEVDPVLLFRFSALTYNGHRIHYDREFARDVDGYPGLVVHGPLQAILMTELTRRAAPLPPRCAFRYRLVAPLFEGQGLTVSGARQGDGSYRCAVRDGSGRQTAAGELTPEAS